MWDGEIHFSHLDLFLEEISNFLFDVLLKIIGMKETLISLVKLNLS